MKNINEEIERIRSLFTEERLYGNLIKEHDCTDLDAAIERVKKSPKHTVYKTSGGKIISDTCKSEIALATAGSSQFHLKCVKQLFDDLNLSYEIFKQGPTEGCVIHVNSYNKKMKWRFENKSRKDVSGEGWSLDPKTKVDHSITFWENGSYAETKSGDILIQSFAIKVTYSPPLKLNEYDRDFYKGLFKLNLEPEEIEEIIIRGAIDDDCKITDMYINKAIIDGGEKIINERYNAWSGGGDPFKSLF